MRTAIVATFIVSVFCSFSIAEAQETSRRATAIPAQQLVPALQSLVKERKFQIVYSSELLANRQTRGAQGNLTMDEALARLLEGTGLVYEYLDRKTVAIRPKPVSGAALGDALRVAEAGTAGQAAKSGDEVEEMLVEGERERRQPFADASIDLPRTIDDVQPYYIFDAKTIQLSGATNIEDFLKKRLTMNTLSQTNAQKAGGYPFQSTGNVSSIDLRGLGQDKTLILINGRRMAGVANSSSLTGGATGQTDLNGIPIDAIERIEVLPTSASGIYGGSAIGGVVNVILKKTYTGAELRATYDNIMDVDAPARTLSANFGRSFEDGRTRFMVSGSWSDAQTFLVRDRRELLERGISTIMRNAPAFFQYESVPFPGVLPNIKLLDDSLTTLTLRDGRPLGSRITYIPAGISEGSTDAELYDALLENAGQWNMDLPMVTQGPTGLLRPLSATPTVQSVNISLSRDMGAGLELFADIAYGENRSTSIYNAFSTFAYIPASASTNPFNEDVFISTPSAVNARSDSKSVLASVTLGLKARLPLGWVSELDYTYSKSSYGSDYFDGDSSETTGYTTAYQNGDLNPFVDALGYPLEMDEYLRSDSFDSASYLDDFALRASGPLWTLPWGAPSLTVGLEHRIATTPENTMVSERSNTLFTAFERKQNTDSGYGELNMPLVKVGQLPAMYSLDLQASGRVERYTVDGGTTGVNTSFDTDPPTLTYDGPTLNNQPYFTKVSYRSSNHTEGVKYQPLSQLALRISKATAFLPPRPNQLIKNPLPGTGTSNVTDPRNGNIRYRVPTITGGNPELTPQNSKSLNAGVIWQPAWRSMQGLRLNAEYYRTQQFDYIGSLSLQQIVNLEDVYSNRITRDPVSGLITLVDRSLFNLYQRETEGWDFGVDYEMSTDAGRFYLHAAHSLILGLREQYTLTSPEYDMVSYVSEGGASRHKSNATLTWQDHGWTLGWTTTYFGSYKANGAPGGPVWLQSGGTYQSPHFQAQGSADIPYQIYHDLLVGYEFPKAGRSVARSTLRNSLLDGLSLQMNIRNVFKTIPPFDASTDSNFFISPYGDSRLRSYVVSVRKQF